MTFDLTCLSTLRSDKTKIALSLEDMEGLESFFRESFRIQKLPDNYDLLSLIRDACGRATAERYRDLDEQRGRVSGSGDAAEAKKKFFDLISVDPLLGLVHSTRWPFIIDSAAYLTALTHALELQGPFLDIGCHGGYHAIWLATECELDGRGVDVSEAAVRYASTRAKELGITSSRLTFDSRRIGDEMPLGGYRLVYSINGPITLDERSFVELLNVLQVGGLFVWVGNASELNFAELHSALNRVGLSLLLSDVIGGWNGKVFMARAVLVIGYQQISGESQDVGTELDAVWKGFSSYCNVSGRGSSDKILSKYRSWVTFGASEGERVRV